MQLQGHATYYSNWPRGDKGGTKGQDGHGESGGLLTLRLSRADRIVGKYRYDYAAYKDPWYYGVVHLRSEAGDILVQAIVKLARDVIGKELRHVTRLFSVLDKYTTAGFLRAFASNAFYAAIAFWISVRTFKRQSILFRS